MRVVLAPKTGVNLGGATQAIFDFVCGAVIPHESDTDPEAIANPAQFVHALAFNEAVPRFCTGNGLGISLTRMGERKSIAFHRSGWRWLEGRHSSLDELCRFQCRWYAYRL